ncbi:MAG TPA: type 4a pilus biogenesis protein PilO [Actinomycetota bacterium]|nr:type 4a pilus biogenesis protein PilO [Actinomycetota bacterium]
MKGRRKIVAAAVAAAFVCGLFYMFFIRPRTSEVAEAKDAVVAAQSERQQLELELETLEDLKKNAPKLNALLERIRGFVPKDDEIPNFIFQVQEAANTAGVSFVQITPELPKPPAQPAPLAEVRITMTASGSFFSLQDFIRRLYTLDRALRIDTLALAAAGAGPEGAQAPGSEVVAADEGELTLTIAARIFFELPEGVVPGAVPPETTPSEETPPTDETAPETEQTTAPEEPAAGETVAPETPAP